MAVDQHNFSRSGLKGLDLLSFLAGHWSLERTASNGSRFLGYGEFLPLDEKRILLRETGKVALADGGALNAGREWVWSILGDQANPVIDIHYPEERGGSLYHHLEFELKDNTLVASDTHLCGDDTYFGKYSLGENIIIIDHTIKGPAKDMEVMARFYRY